MEKDPGQHRFPKTRNIERSFQFMRAVALLSVVGSFVFGVVLFFKALRVVEEDRERIYILSAGKAFEAFASDSRINLPVEARAEIADFHNAFFTLDPDEKQIEAGLKKALYLADGSAKRVYDNLKESGYFGGVISANISQRLTVDSVSLDMGQHPFSFRCYGTLQITRTTSIVTRDLVTQGLLREVTRSDNNPHGFLIERWEIVENRDLKVENR
jgi:conjugative transposon TraK protein